MSQNCINHARFPGSASRWQAVRLSLFTKTMTVLGLSSKRETEKWCDFPGSG
jgi:hypothetical protein